MAALAPSASVGHVPRPPIVAPPVTGPHLPLPLPATDVDTRTETLPLPLGTVSETIADAPTQLNPVRGPREMPTIPLPAPMMYTPRPPIEGSTAVVSRRKRAAARSIHLWLVLVVLFFVALGVAVAIAIF